MYEEKRKKEREKERKKERDRIVHKKISNETIVSENIINQRLNYYISRVKFSPEASIIPV